MNEIASERNRLVAKGIALLVLAILAGTAHRFPEAERIVIGFLSVGGIIRVVILFIMLGIIVLSARPLLTTVAVYYAHSGFRTRELPERRKVGVHVTGLATEIVNVIVIAISWAIAASAVRTLLPTGVARDFD